MSITSSMIESSKHCFVATWWTFCQRPDRWVFARSLARENYFWGYQWYTNAREMVFERALSDCPWIHASLHGSLSKAPAKRSSCHGHSRRFSFAATSRIHKMQSEKPGSSRGKPSGKCSKNCRAWSSWQNLEWMLSQKIKIENLSQHFVC